MTGRVVLNRIRATLVSSLACACLFVGVTKTTNAGDAAYSERLNRAMPWIITTLFANAAVEDEPAEDADDLLDADGDGINNLDDIDDDNDGQTDAHERACGSDPRNAASLAADLDGDDVPDCKDRDDDGDGQRDADEQMCGSNPRDANSLAPDSRGYGWPDCTADFAWSSQDWTTQNARLGELGTPQFARAKTEIHRVGDQTRFLRRSSIELSRANAAEHANLPGYIATGKSNCCGNQERVPFRTYTAACATATNEPRLFVSMTLELRDGTSPNYKPSSPRLGSVLEFKLNPATGAFEPTGNQSLLPVCNEAHGIAVSEDCSTVGMLCAPSYEEPYSEHFEGSVVDLTTTPSKNPKSGRNGMDDNIANIIQPNNLDYDYPEALYAGEMWLLEWEASQSGQSDGSGGVKLGATPDKYVIHRSFGGQPVGGAHDLVYEPTHNTYATVIPASTFRSTGKRHKSAAMLVIDRDSTNPEAIDGFQLTPDERGWFWECGWGHVMHARVFWNPYTHNEHLSDLAGEDVFGAYGALCTTDFNRYRVQDGGNIAIKYEDSSTFISGYSHYMVPSDAFGATGGAGHTMLPIDENLTLGIAATVDAERVAGFTWAEDRIAEWAGTPWSVNNNLGDLQACAEYIETSYCLQSLAEEWEYTVGSTYPVFFKDSDGGSSDWMASGRKDVNDISKIGLFKTQSERGYSLFGYLWDEDPIARGAKMKWIAEDPDCSLASPQMVDLRNGRYLVGYGKFQCISDGWEFSRIANAGRRKREEAMRIPSAYYLMEIDAQGNVLVDPFEVDAGWGGHDKLISVGVGRAAWLFVKDATLPQGNTSYPDPSQTEWEVYLYESP
ncbi:MAG: hypothetical protein AAFY29_15785 [Pseudomonadota bacterium]